MADTDITPSPKRTPVFTLSSREAFPYNRSTTESKFFRLPIEIRQQIYRLAFYTPNTAFQKIIKGWRDTPMLEDLTRKINNNALLRVNKKMRTEALPIFYKHTTFRLESKYHVREFMNAACNADSAHMFIRKISIVPWSRILNSSHLAYPYDKHGRKIVQIIADLPSLREVELSAAFLPADTAYYEEDEWMTLMETLRANNGVLRVVDAQMQGMWGRAGVLAVPNYGWGERMLLKTSFDVRDWSELVEAHLGNFGWYHVYDATLDANWIRGPLKAFKAEVEGKMFGVRFWGIPDDIRKKKDRREMRREYKKEYDERRTVEAGRRKKPGVVVDYGLESEGEDVGVAGERSRRTFTREEARARRMGKEI